MARKQLTQKTVENLRPDPTKDIERPDHLYPALRLRVYPSGKRTFWIRTRIAGKPVNYRLEKVELDLAKARDATRDFLAEIAKGYDPRQAKQRVKATTLGGVVELFLKHSASEVSNRTQIERERHLRRDWKPLHHRPIAEITKREVAGRLLEIKDEHGAIAANRSRGTLFRLFEWLVDQDLVEVNVVASTRRPLRREPTRDRVLSIEERGLVWQATVGGSAYDGIVRLALLTGQRKAEIGGLKWSEVDLKDKVISLAATRTKNRRAHVVPLSEQAVEIIRARLDDNGQPQGDADGQPAEYVFGALPSAPFSGWSRGKRRLDERIARKRAEDRLGRPLKDREEPDVNDRLEAWVVHDLRRSAVTGMKELGTDSHLVELIVNHVSGTRAAVAGTYDKSERLAERRVALQRWADYLTAEPARKVVDFAARSA